MSIGAKLGVSAAVGIVLAATIGVVQVVVGNHVAESEELAERQETIHDMAMSANIVLRRMQVSANDIRLSFDAATVAQLAASVKTDLAEVKTGLAEAEALAMLPANKERIANLSARVGDYASATLAVAEAHLKELAGSAARDEVAAQWDERSDKARDVLGATSDPDRMQTLLSEVERDFQTLRADSWRFVASQNPALVTAMTQAADHGTATLETLLSSVGGTASIAGPIRDLSETYAAYVAATRAMIADISTSKTIVERDAQPAAAAAVELVRATIAAARQRVSEATEEAEAAALLAERVIFGMIGLLAVALLGSAAYAAWGVARPISAMTRAMERIAAGELSTPIPSAGRGDEVGDQAKVLGTFRDGLAEAARLREERAEAERAAAAQRRSEMNDLAERFEAAVGGIVDMVSSASTELQAAAQSLTATAEETTAQAAAVAAAAEEAAANVQTVAAAIEELSASASEIGQQVTQSTSVAGRAVGEADQTNVRMSSLRTDAEKVGAIVGLIGDIAAQTNLLALNATIESARAGEAGKGFAVVAQEVKSLAEQTAKATAEISAQIGGMQGSTVEAVSAITSIGRTIGEMNGIAAAIVAAVEEQGATTAEVARNVQQAALGASEVTANISGVTQAAEVSSAAATQVLASASELARHSETLRGEVRRFVDFVRAA